MMETTWLPDVEPEDLDELADRPEDQTIVDAAIARGITDVVHFTRARGGVIGIMSTGFVRPRLDLPTDARIRHIYEENAADRSRDEIWWGYVNLSLSDINRRMFAFSKTQHPDAEWAVLSFGPEVLGHPGVTFCTTNNAYQVAHRARGLAGFEQLFAPRVPWGYYGSERKRSGRLERQPTDPQAEVLYPGPLSVKHLHSIVVGNDETCDTVNAALSHFPLSVEVIIDAGVFE